MYNAFNKYCESICGLRIVIAIIVALFTLILFLTPEPTSAQSVVSFDSLVPGTILTDQLQSNGVKFVPYTGRVTPTIIVTSAGNVADFNHCEGSIGCEFFASGARGIFSDPHRFLKIHTGLVPGSTPFEAQISLTAYDANGQIVSSSSAMVTAGAGFSTEIVATSPVANIVSFVVQATDDPAQNANIALLNLEFDPPGPMRSPDFILEGPPAVTIVAGGPAVDVPLTMTRIGGSVGGISLSMMNLPNGVVATFLPQQTFGSSATLRLRAPGNQSNSTSIATVVGTPTTPGAGGSQHSHSIYVRIEEGLTLYGPSMVDLSGCSNVGAQGIVMVPFTVMRHPTVSGPVDLSVTNLPAEVSYSFSSSKLNFPGWSVGGNSTLTLTATAGIAIPDTVVRIQITNGTIHDDFALLIHGTCPRQNKNFVIRGKFSCQTVFGHMIQVDHAQVEFFRYRSVGSDDKVGETHTNPDGTFQGSLWANTEGDYYAKLVLDDTEGVHLNDSWTSSFWSTPTSRQNNREAIVDLGEWVISKDNGWGTPKCAIWQGARTAYQEFKTTVGSYSPPGDYSIVLYKGFLSPFSYLATTNWPDNYPTGWFREPPNFSPLATPPQGDKFHDYVTNFHEFGHTVRHSLDGDQAHFLFDAATFTYARKHNHCNDPSQGYHENDGFAFNEGWAEYWSRDTAECPNALTNANIEGTVAHDLDTLAQCPQLGATDDARRRNMLTVLWQGQNIIHSDADFRRYYTKLFPGCTIPPPLVAIVPRPQSDVFVSVEMNLTLETQGQPKELAPDQTAQLTALRADIDAQAQITAHLQIDLEAAAKVAADTGVCPPVPCELVAERVVRPAILMGAIERSELLERQLESDFAAMQRGERSLPQFNQQFEAERMAAVRAFDNESKEVVKRTLDRAISDLAPFVAHDNTGVLTKQSDDLALQLRLLQMRTPTNDAYLTLLKLPRSDREDRMDLATAVPLQWSLKRIVLVVGVIVIGLVLVGIIARMLHLPHRLKTLMRR